MASLTATSLETLQTFLKDEVLSTVQTYFEIKILENGTWYTFLKDRLHELFHFYLKRESCCDSSQPCASFPRHGTLTKDQFEFLYKTDYSVLPDHEKKDRRGRIVLHCICPLSPNPDNDVVDLDFTLINTLMKTCHQTPAGNPKWLKDILDVRNHLSHLGDTSSISDQQLSEWWTTLENAATNISGTVGKAFQKGVKRRIDKIKTSQSQLEDFMKALKTRDGDFEQKIMDVLHNIGIQIDNVRFQIERTEFVTEQPKISCAMTSAPTQTDASKCIVVWKFSNPGDWEIEAMQRKLECINAIGDFNIQFVYQGSLIIHSTVDRALLLNAETFKDAIEEFLLIFSKKLNLSAQSCISVNVTIWSNLEQAKVNQGLTSKIEEQGNTKEAQVHVLQNKLPPKLKYLCHIPISGGTKNCTVVGNTLVITQNIISDLDLIYTFDIYVRHISRLRMRYSNPEVLMPLPGERRNISFVGKSKDDYSRSWAVTSMSSSLVAVTVGTNTHPFTQTDVFVIDIMKKSVHKKISVDEDIYGFDFYKEHFYLGCSDSIQVMDIHGQIIKTLPAQLQPIVIKLNEDKIYYSDSNNLVCCDISGNQLWKFKNSIIRQIGGLTIDEEGNIYATGTESHNIVVISSDGKHFKELQPGVFGLWQPVGLCYYENTLIVCYSGKIVLLEIDDPKRMRFPLSYLHEIS